MRGGRQYPAKEWALKSKIGVQKAKDFKEKERLRSKVNYQKLKATKTNLLIKQKPTWKKEHSVLRKKEKK